MSNIRYKMMKIAKSLSEKGEHKQHRLGCVIAKKNEVLGVGFNRNRTHPKSLHPYKSLHAELDAVLGVPRWKLQGATAYVYREYKNGHPALAKPCEYCYNTLMAVGVKEVIYTTPKGYETLTIRGEIK